MSLPLEWIDRLRGRLTDEEIDFLNEGWSRPVPGINGEHPLSEDSPRTSMDASELVRRRSKDAARKREERAKKRAAASADAIAAPIYIDREERDSEEKKVKKEKKDIRRKRAMPDDWWPSEVAIQRVKLKYGSQEAEIRLQVEKMRNHFLAKGGVSTNWDLNFYNWMSNQAEWRGNGRVQPSSSNNKPSVFDAMRQRLDEVGS